MGALEFLRIRVGDPINYFSLKCLVEKALACLPMVNWLVNLVEDFTCPNSLLVHQSTHFMVTCKMCDIGIFVARQLKSTIFLKKH